MAVIAIAILGFVLAQPQTVVVRYCSTASEATEVRQLLTSNDIPCTVGSNFEIIIDKKDEIDFIACEEKNSNYFGSGFIDDVCFYTDK